MQIRLKRINYQKPELIEIKLLDESAMGSSGLPEEPPMPAPPGGAPPNHNGMLDGYIPPGP